MAHPTSTTVTAKRLAIAVAIAAGLSSWTGLRRTDAQATPAPAPTASAARPSAAAAARPAEAEKTTATIRFMTSPASNATVTWGSERIGRIGPGEPLVIVRPRDSGPLDVVVRAQGYLPVTTRAHTFNDHEMMVKLTAPTEQHKLLGYRAPIETAVPEATTDSSVPSSLFYAPPGTGAAGAPAQPAPQ
jgi:hypothetical protein